MHFLSRARRAVLSVTTLGVLTSLVLGSGVAAAATDGEFWLGRVNRTTHTTTLADTTGTPLSLRAPRGTAPLAVNSPVRVRNLNADLLDGLDAGVFQRRLTGACGRGTFVVAVARSGRVSCSLETYAVVWQLAVRPDGSTSVKHTGLTAVRNGAGDYTLTWSSFPGRALPYCSGIGRAAVVVSESAEPDGSGNVRLTFDQADTGFTCVLIGSP
jgi:hypothetical protein